MTFLTMSTFSDKDMAVTLLIFGVFEALFHAPVNVISGCSLLAPTCFGDGLGLDRNSNSLSSTSDATELLSLLAVFLGCGRRLW